MGRRNSPDSAWRRSVRLASLIVLLLGAVAVGWPWLLVAVRDFRVRRLILRLLLAADVAYGALWLGLVVAVMGLGFGVWWARRRGIRRPALVRGLMLCTALTLGLILAEATAWVWLAWTGRPVPPPPAASAERSRRVATEDRDRGTSREPTRVGSSASPDDDVVDIVVVGESSACGFPYGEWLSPGEIVAWKLREAIPDRQFRVELAARSGITLEIAQGLLGRVTRRPDLVIVYAGHNEFDARYYWDRTPRHYVHQTPPTDGNLASSAPGLTPVTRLIERAVVHYRVSTPPPPHARRPLVDVPAYTPAEYAERLRDFRTRLEAIAGDCERLGALVVLVPPPANDADFEPDRSYLRPETTRAERQVFARDFEAARRIEPADPGGAIDAYRTLLARQPGFAEAHYRLGRLLEAAGRGDEADRHYIAARDRDGFPVRCMSDFLDAYHDLAARHPHAILVDAPAILRQLSPRHTLGDEFFADAHHPSLDGYAAVCQAILAALCARRAFGWPASSPPPRVVPAEFARAFRDGRREVGGDLRMERPILYARRAGPLRPDAAARQGSALPRGGAAHRGRRPPRDGSHAGYRRGGPSR